jgi:acyl-homoserine lactone acylase PvdQ
MEEGDERVPRMRRVAIAIATRLATLAISAVPASAVQPPKVMAALGDSITRAFNSDGPGCPTVPSLDCPKNSWSTGTNPAVNSQFQRIEAIDPGRNPVAYNDARSSVRMGDKRFFARRALCSCALAVGLVLGGLAPAAYSDSPPDFSSPGEAWNVLPPGESGNSSPGSNSINQIPLYDGLTPLFDQVTDSDLPTYFKPNIFGLGGETPRSVEQPRPGLRIERDSKGVAHVFGDTRADVMYGAGWVTVEDRDQPGAPLMELLRGPGRVAALDVPGIDPFSLVFTGRQFMPSAQTEAFLSNQISLLQGAGPEGQQVIDDVDNYLQGINDKRSELGTPGPPWTRNDVIAVACLIGARFGKGGGDEARRAQFLSALQQRLGDGAGRKVFNDLREQNDPEHYVSVPGKFKLNSEEGDGNAVIDAGSIGTAAAEAAATAQSAQAAASNALLLGASRSQNGHPLFVAGPQVGYTYPEILYEADLHGGGIDARGATFPGSGPYVELGRGPDFSWSATSSGTDIIDQFVETLCGGSDLKYMFKGQCMDMTTFDAGTLGPGPGPPAGPVTLHETVHGPVSGYATSNGQRVAISNDRSTRGRELMSAIGFEHFNDGGVHDPASFFDAASKIEFTFNWFYADDQNIAMFSSGRVPVRAAGVDLGLPTVGTGAYEWNGFYGDAQHPQAVNPTGARIINWNNKPAAGWTAADDEWAYGSVHRAELLEHAVARQTTHTLGSLVAAMNRAATQDLRNDEVLSAIQAVLDTGPAPSPREQQMLDLLEQWRADGSSRLDRDLDGKIDAPGAAIMDAAWPKIADAVMSPVLGPQLSTLASLIGRDNRPSNQGSAYGSGWYGYVDKDLRSLLDKHVPGAFKTQFCGAGDLTACRNALWQALKDAGDQLAATQGTNDPAQWRSDANAERIGFGARFPLTMRWTNRPTFQQVISYSGHR